MGYTTLNGGLEERAWSSHSFKTVSFPGPFLPAHFPLGDGIHEALSRPFALLRPCSLLVETHPFMAPASKHLPMWSDLHLELCQMSPGTPHLSVPQVNQTHITKSKSPPPQTCSSHWPWDWQLHPLTDPGVISYPFLSLSSPGLIDLTHLCPFSPSLLPWPQLRLSSLSAQPR